MAGTAVLRRLSWQVGTVAESRPETATAVTLALDLPEWTTHLAGQHVDVRLTAPDGYSTQRSYSIASAPSPGRVEITVQRVEDGEVSPYLVDVARPGDELELRGPIGGYFVWRAADPEPVLLVAGGSGIVPLMAMARTRAAAGSRTPMRLIYSVRGPEDAIYADELRRRVRDDHGLDVSYAYTRRAPDGWNGVAGRVDAARLGAGGWPADLAPRIFVCGPTGFVETVADLLVDAGHDPGRIRTERFGPTGG
ncbi:MAG TPA: ferredoxin reductase [Micromonosporaceae bacterium]|nr:ferredoxin reductase [Micromonosporaceae bacterium]